MSALVTILVFIAVIAITAVIFGGWIIFSIVRGIFGAVAWLLDAPRPQQAIAHSSEGIRCANQRCHATNPAGARFCRRCGTVLPEVQRVAVRRAAVW